MTGIEQAKNLDDAPEVEHRARIFRDLCAPRGSMFAWRARCTCMGSLPSDAEWKPAWAARTYDDAMALVGTHLSDPREDDWLRLLSTVPGVVGS